MQAIIPARPQESVNLDALATPDALLARLLYRDALMLVIDKPAGIAVHRGPANRLGDSLRSPASLDELFGGLRFGLPRDPALAHRLDRGTSGCLVLGRHRKALETLGQLFKGGRIGKTYWAVVDGEPEADEGLIELPLGRRDATRGWWMKVDPAGLASQTRWRVLGRAPGRAVLALEPLTGRTHQLRVHCQAMGWPIHGDMIYGHLGVGDAGAEEAREPMLRLHARSIVVPLYRNKPAVTVTAPVPAHMRDDLAACGVICDQGAAKPAKAATTRS